MCKMIPLTPPDALESRTQSGGRVVDVTLNTSHVWFKILNPTSILTNAYRRQDSQTTQIPGDELYARISVKVENVISTWSPILHLLWHLLHGPHQPADLFKFDSRQCYLSGNCVSFLVCIVV